MELFKPDVKKMRAKNDVRGLIKALKKSHDIRIVGAVEDALEDIGLRTTEAFIEALRDRVLLFVVESHGFLEISKMQEPRNHPLRL